MTVGNWCLVVAGGGRIFKNRALVQFSSVPWLIGMSWDMRDNSAEILFQSFPQEALVSSLACAGMSTFWSCPSSIFSADHGVVHLPWCLEGWFWRCFRGVWHVRTMQVSVTWQLPEEVPVDPQGSWSCSAPSRWSCAPCRRYGEVSSCT